MKDNIEIQQEFENLVAELEKLRTINQLTSTNEESARSVVEKIENIANSVSELSAIIESDFKNKSDSLDNLLTNLPTIVSQSAKGIVDEFKEAEKKHRESVLDEYRIKLDEFSTQLTLQVENEKQNRNDIKRIINSEINHYRGIINPLKVELNGKINELSVLLQELNSLKNGISDYLETFNEVNFSKRLNNLDANISSLGNSVQVISNTVESAEQKINGNLNTEFEKVIQHLLLLENKIEAKNKERKVFDIITWGLIIISLVLIMFVK